jgi:hypothetical protein
VGQRIRNWARHRHTRDAALTGFSWRLPIRAPAINISDMPRKPKLKPDNPEQFKRFIEMAREVEVDESPEALDRALGRIISAPKGGEPKTQQKLLRRKDSQAKT